jgi:hypothetical protein
MPHKTWVHICPKSGNREIGLGVEICRDCEQKGRYDGLGLTGTEAMGTFGKLTGLPPIGPHMPQMPHYSEQCPACNGRSIVEIHQWKKWVSCRSCDGTGSIVTVSEDRFIEIQKSAWIIFDNWRLEKADESKTKEITESQKARVYKKIFKRDHYRPKRNRRTLRYFARMEKLMYESIDSDLAVEKTPVKVTPTTHLVYEEETWGDVIKNFLVYMLLIRAIHFLFTFWN